MQASAAATILEPVGRNTAPARGRGRVMHSRHNGDDPLLMVLPSDHLISTSAFFDSERLHGAAHAEQGVSGDLRRRADGSRDRLWLHSGRGKPGRVRNPAGRDSSLKSPISRHRQALCRLWPLLLEQRHVPVQGIALLEELARHSPDDSGRGHHSIRTKLLPISISYAWIAKPSSPVPPIRSTMRSWKRRSP